MGFLKKITKPLSKILDKIIPNEVKPALPFLSAMAPFMLPANIAGGAGLSAILRRAALTGGLNIGSQLAQEGSEGDFSGLSALMAAGTGALTAPNAGATLRGVDPNFIGPNVAPEGIMGTGREWLAKAADFLGPQTGGAADILGKGGTKAGLDMATLKAAALPISQGMGDLAMADARRALKDYERELAATGDTGSNEDRALAIRLAMEAGGHSEETIVETIRSLGYKQGGRVNKEGGGILEIEFKEMADGGMTDTVLPTGQEMDYRGGGMIPMGSKERADDVPARLSKNEFVMTADAVRAAGGGSVNVGAKRMYDLMHNLEARV